MSTVPAQSGAQPHTGSSWALAAWDPPQLPGPDIIWEAEGWSREGQGGQGSGGENGAG